MDMNTTTAFLSLKEIATTESGQRCWRLLFDEEKNGFSKLAHYATHYVEMPRQKIDDLISPFNGNTNVTLTEYALFGNSQLFTFVGPMESKLKKAEGRVYLKHVEESDLYEVLCDVRGATHFITVLYGCCEEMKANIGSQLAGAFFSVFKDGEGKKVEIEKIADSVPLVGPKPISYFTISFKYGAVSNDLVAAIPTLICQASKHPMADVYLRGEDAGMMNTLRTKFSYNAARKSPMFSLNEVMELAKQYGDANVVLFDKDDQEMDLFTTKNTPAEVIDLEVDDTVEQGPYYVCFKEDTHADGFFLQRISLCGDDFDFMDVCDYYLEFDTKKQADDFCFEHSMVKLFSIWTGIAQGMGKWLKCNKFSPSSPSYPCSNNTVSPHMTPCSPCSSMSPPHTAEDDEVTVVFIVTDTDPVLLEVSHTVEGPAKVTALDGDYYVRFTSRSEGMRLFAMYEKNFQVTDLFDLELNLEDFSTHSGLQKTPVFTNPKYILSLTECTKEGPHNGKNDKCLQVSEAPTSFATADDKWICYAEFDNPAKCKALYEKMKSWDHISIDAFKRQLYKVSDGKDVTFYSKLNGEKLVVPHFPRPTKYIRNSIANLRELPKQRSLDDEIVQKVLEVSSRKRVERTEEPIAPQAPAPAKRQRRRRMTEIEQLHAMKTF